MAADRGVTVAPRGAWCHNNRSAISRELFKTAGILKERRAPIFRGDRRPIVKPRGWLLGYTGSNSSTPYSRVGLKNQGVRPWLLFTAPQQI
jgi:hypothetical protein